MAEFNSGIILKVILIIQFVLTVWASMSPMFPASYIYCHAVVLLLGAWSIFNEESASHILMFLIFNVVSVPLDVIFLSIFQPVARDQFESGRELIFKSTSLRLAGASYSTTTYQNLYRFSLGMAILNLLFKPLTCLVSFRIFQERGGSYSNINFPGLPSLVTGARGGQYENIDQPVPTNQVETAGPHQSLEKPPPNYSEP